MITEQYSPLLQRTTKKMMQSEPLIPSWPTLINLTNTPLDQNTPYDFYGVDEYNLLSSFASPDDSSMISSNSYLPHMLLDELFDLENFDDEIHMCSSMEGSIEEICEWINKNENDENSFSPVLTVEGDEWIPYFSPESNQSSLSFPVTDMSLVLPGDDMEVDDQLSLLHLLRAYGEAMENGEKELAEVIVKSIKEKSNPMGSTMERVAYNLFLSRENYLREEASKNLVAGFKVLYQSLPNGRFAHFTANSAILESMPHDAQIVRIVDFDIGEGIQWPPLIEALSRRGKALILTAIQPEEECSSACWDFEDTKRHLMAYATQYGVKLVIEEKSINELCSAMMRIKRGEWVVFNCMVGLPHMGRRRLRKRVDEFLCVAKDILAIVEGIVTLGDGDQPGEINVNNCCSYSSYFDCLLRHYQALFESLERNFPSYLAEARTAMESMFLAPYMCPVAWFRDWEERRQSRGVEHETPLKGLKLSQESLAEARQMVVERENSYEVKIERLREHEMVLQWRETPLVRVSTWV